MHNCAVTHDDQLLIADSWNHCVRRINLASGIIDTIIGTGAEGFSGDGGPARDATFNFLMCISLNRAKTLLHIIDLKNRRVREVDLSSGTVTTIAGNGQRGVPDDGARATQSPLVDPRAVASDSKGNVYVLERGGNALRVVRPDGTIHTVAGTGQQGRQDGPALEATFGSPKHLCTDNDDRVYIADDLNGAIRRYDPDTGRVETVLGQGRGDSRIRLLHPHGVSFHDGTLYVVDSGNHRILGVKNR
jgi:sugar lactone lactonase YvrE